MALQVATKTPYQSEPVESAYHMIGSVVVDCVRKLKPLLPEILLAKVAIFVDLYAKTAEVRQQSQQLQATVGTLEHEIAERERVEAALRRARDQLEQRVRERTAGLAEANQALRAEIAERKRLEGQLIQSQKMESIGRLAGGIAGR